MNKLIATIIFLCASSASAQDMMTAEEAKLFHTMVDNIKYVHEYDEACNPLENMNRLKDKPRILKEVGIYCRMFTDIAVQFAEEQAQEDADAKGVNLDGCDFSVDAVKKREGELNAARRFDERYRSKSIRKYWIEIYKEIYTCTPAMRATFKASSSSVTPGTPLQVQN